MAFHLNSSIAIFQYIYCEPFPKIYELLFCYPQSVNNEKNLNFRTINLQCLLKQFALLKTFWVYIFAWSTFYKNIVIGKILRFLVKIISIQNGIQTYLKIFSISLLNRNGVNEIWLKTKLSLFPKIKVNMWNLLYLKKVWYSMFLVIW